METSTENKEKGQKMKYVIFNAWTENVIFENLTKKQAFKKLNKLPDYYGIKTERRNNG